jgi:hypothetical protein
MDTIDNRLIKMMDCKVKSIFERAAIEGKKFINKFLDEC